RPRRVEDAAGIPEILIQKPYPNITGRETAMMTKDEIPACPVATTVQLIGSKWKLLILRDLLSRPWRFNELRRDLEGVSQKVLTDSLRALEADGIVRRTVYPEVPPRVEYSLTELGRSLQPILDAMKDWGEQYKAQNLPGQTEA